jgi:heme/copper-type cytochrome/quinol oxidase subunit 2
VKGAAIMLIITMLTSTIAMAYDGHVRSAKDYKGALDKNMTIQDIEPLSTSKASIIDNSNGSVWIFLSVLFFIMLVFFVYLAVKYR